MWHHHHDHHQATPIEMTFKSSASLIQISFELCLQTSFRSLTGAVSIICTVATFVSFVLAISVVVVGVHNIHVLKSGWWWEEEKEWGGGIHDDDDDRPWLGGLGCTPRYYIKHPVAGTATASAKVLSPPRARHSFRAKRNVSQWGLAGDGEPTSTRAPVPLIKVEHILE